MEKKNKIDLKVILVSILLALTLIPLIYECLAFGNPSKYNVKLDYLEPGTVADAYLHTSENYITLSFLAIAMAFFVLVLLDYLLRKKSSHIITCFLGGLLTASYSLARGIYCINVGSISTVVGVVYIIAFVLILISSGFFVKKSLDGDCGGLYYLFLILGGIAFYFASATSSSYSILNAYSMQGDVVYWCGYAVSRFYLLSFCLMAFTNLTCDYFPSISQNEDVAETNQNESK